VSERDDLKSCAGYCQLVTEIERDEETSKSAHDYRGKLAWIVERAEHYSERLGVSVERVIDGWEAARDYWYMNYYQEANQPRLDGARVRVFETSEDLCDAIGAREFRCPACGGVSPNPYECESGVEVDGKPCDWKVYGLFRDLGRGVHVYSIEDMQGETIFMPIAWEDDE